MLKNIESLNKKIDNLMKERTKSEAQKEVWEGRLHESIAKYAKDYGVDLSGQSISVIKEKLSKEIEKVETETVKEYEQAQKLVSLIESGDIKGAWKELGVDLDAKEEATPESEQKGLQGVSEAILDVEDDNFSDEDFFGADLEDTDEEVEDGDFFVEEEEDEVEEAIKKPVLPEKEGKIMPLFGGISFDDDDDEDDFITPPSKNTVKSASPSSVKSKNTKSGVGIVLDDDEDEDPFGGSFGGFGGILAGSKFDPGKKR